MSYKDWRVEDGLVSKTSYKRKFAWLRVHCSDGSSVWLSSYYKKFVTWNSAHGSGMEEWDYGHTDFIENVSEADYIVRKLAESL